MAGTLRGLTQVVTGTVGLTIYKNMFSKIISFMDSHTAYTRVASYYGDPEYSGPVQAAGLGFGPSGSANAVGDAAWAVYRKSGGGTDVFDIFLGFSYNVDTRTHPSGGWYVGRNTNLGFGVMWAWNSGSNSWDGTTANTGSDYFTTPWKSNAILMPFSNELANPVAGGYSTTGSRNAAACISPNGPNSQAFLICVGDDDSLFISWDAASTRDYPNGFLLERYVPWSDDFDLPYVLIARSWTTNNASFIPATKMNGVIATTGITLKKNNVAGRTFLTSSYIPKVEYPKYLTQGYGLTGWTRFPYSITSSTNVSESVSEFPVHLGIHSPVKQYAGYTTFFRAVPGFIGNNVIYGSSSRCSFAFSFPGPSPTVAGEFASGSIPWSGSFTSHPSSSTNTRQNVFLTASHGAHIAYMPVTVSLLFEDIVSSSGFDFYMRGRLGSNYLTNLNSAPPGTTDAVVLYTNYGD